MKGCLILHNFKMLRFMVQCFMRDTLSRVREHLFEVLMLKKGGVTYSHSSFLIRHLFKELLNALG